MGWSIDRSFSRSFRQAHVPLSPRPDALEAGSRSCGRGNGKATGRLILAFVAALVLHAFAAMWRLPPSSFFPRRPPSRSASVQEGLTVALVPELSGGETPQLEMRHATSLQQPELEEIQEKPVQVPPETPLSDRTDKEQNNTPMVLPISELNKEPLPAPLGMGEQRGGPTNEGSPVPMGGRDSLVDNTRQGDIARQDLQVVWLDASDVRPRYPLGSRVRGETGTVVIKLRLGVDGLARDVEVISSSGFRALDKAALEAVRKARFRIVGKETVGQEAMLTIRFELVN